jgi:hypothetical protein
MPESQVSGLRQVLNNSGAIPNQTPLLFMQGAVQA